MPKQRIGLCIQRRCSAPVRVGSVQLLPERNAFKGVVEHGKIQAVFLPYFFSRISGGGSGGGSVSGEGGRTSCGGGGSGCVGELPSGSCTAATRTSRGFEDL